MEKQSGKLERAYECDSGVSSVQSTMEAESLIDLFFSLVEQEISTALIMEDDID
jgi:hypothetical protein